MKLTSESTRYILCSAIFSSKDGNHKLIAFAYSRTISRTSKRSAQQTRKPSSQTYSSILAYSYRCDSNVYVRKYRSRTRLLIFADDFRQGRVLQLSFANNDFIDQREISLRISKGPRNKDRT